MAPFSFAPTELGPSSREFGTPFIVLPASELAFRSCWWVWHIPLPAWPKLLGLALELAFRSCWWEWHMPLPTWPKLLRIWYISFRSGFQIMLMRGCLPWPAWPMLSRNILGVSHTVLPALRVSYMAPHHDESLQALEEHPLKWGKPIYAVPDSLDS